MKDQPDFTWMLLMSDVWLGGLKAVCYDFRTPSWPACFSSLPLSSFSLMHRGPSNPPHTLLLVAFPLSTQGVSCHGIVQCVSLSLSRCLCRISNVWYLDLWPLGVLAYFLSLSLPLCLFPFFWLCRRCSWVLPLASALCSLSFFKGVVTGGCLPHILSVRLEEPLKSHS